MHKRPGICTPRTTLHKWLPLLCSGMQSRAHANLTADRKNLKLWILLNSSLQLLFAVSQAVTVRIDLTPQPGRRLCV